MTPDFVGAVIDTLLPGDDGAPPLPSGTAAGVAATLLLRLAAPRDGDAVALVLDAAARRLGGEAAFVRADLAQRTAALEAVEREMPAAFGSLVSLALQHYYEAEPVLRAMGWRAAPPQPDGHAVEPLEEALLGRVKRCAPMWRDPGAR